MLAQVRKLGPYLLALYALPIIFLAGVVLASLKMDVPFGLFTRDPASYTELHPLTGIASNLGFVVWIATATICIFSAALLRGRANQEATRYANSGANTTDNRNIANYLLGAGLLTALLAFDDFFLIHDTILPQYLGMDEKVMYALYACLAISGAVIFRTVILKTEYAMLLLAFGFFGLSLCIDMLQETLEPTWGDWRIFLEDSSKFLGIVGWFGYFSRCSYLALRTK
jgi:hypothetical protein